MGKTTNQLGIIIIQEPGIPINQPVKWNNKGPLAERATYVQAKKDGGGGRMSTYAVTKEVKQTGNRTFHQLFPVLVAAEWGILAPFYGVENSA